MTCDNTEEASSQFVNLINLMEKLRAPGGCAWDRKQTHSSLKEHLLEEAREVAEAVDAGDPIHLKEELGDLSMIIVFFAVIAQEKGSFTMSGILKGIIDKLISRHPHVFGSEKIDRSPDEVTKKWNEIKVHEKRMRGMKSFRMAEVCNYVSQLKAAHAIQDEAACAGFDFPDIKSVLAKVKEELTEVENCLQNTEGLEMELGDLFFAVTNLARLLKFDPEAALKKANIKFVERFRVMEHELEAAGGFEGKTIEELDRYWEAAKDKEKSSAATKPDRPLP